VIEQFALDVVKLVIGVAIGSFIGSKMMMWMVKRDVKRLVSSPEVRDAVQQLVATAAEEARRRVAAILGGGSIRAGAAAQVSIDVPRLEELVARVEDRGAVQEDNG